MNPSLEFIVRPAQIGDAPEIANVHLNSWRESYAGLLPQEYLDKMPLTFKSRFNWWTEVIQKPEQYVLFVAEGKSRIFGFAVFGPGRDERFKGFAELGATYMLRQFKGQGIGYSLLQKGMVQMRERGFPKAYCWVLEKNPTIKFYERTGAIHKGLTKTDEIGGQKVCELAYIWEDLSGF